MRHIRWCFRPTTLVGLAMLLVVAGLALGIRARWNAARGEDHLAEGRLALEQGDTDRALAEFSEAISIDPLSVEARRERARLLIRRDRWEEAVVDLDAALQRAPGDAALYVLRAETYAGMGRDLDRPDALDRAIADAEEALRLDPSQALAFCQRALANSAKFNDDKALADAEEAVRRVANDARVFVARGRVRLGRGEYEKALADFSEAIRLDPNNARALALRGVCRFELHDAAAALADCNRAVELAPRDGRVYCYRAMIYRTDRGCAKELADLDRALEQNPCDLISHVQRAACRMERHDARRAFADCASALAINPDSSLALATRSLCHLARGRKKRALDDLEKAVGLRPDYPVLRCVSAAFYQMEDEPDKALAECDMALKGGNDWSARKAYLLRAVSLLQKEDIQGAIADCNKALKLNPKSVAAYAIRSVAYYQAGDADRSRSAFDAALGLDREKAYQHRAETFDLLKLNIEAIADLTELIKLTPEEASPYHARAVAYLEPLLQPAAMGVGWADPNTLIISVVQPNMPAAKAGLRVGDKIVRVGSLQPTHGNQVVDHIASFRPGATLEMEIARNGEHEVFRMVLEARPLGFGNPNQMGGRPQLDRALDDCKQVVKLDPENPVAHRLLGEAYDLLDRPDDAIRSATEALRLDPEDPLAHLSRARSYLARKEDDKAIDDINEALRLEAEGGLPYVLRGLAYADKKMVEQAKADLAQGVRLNPKLAEVKEAYDRQLAQEKAGLPPPFPDIRIPDFKIPFEKPARLPSWRPSGGEVQVFLGIGAVIFAIAVLAGYFKAKAR